MHSKPIVGNCRLCHREEPLVDSHVIPKFHYNPLKEKEGRYHIVSSEADQRDRTGQKGITERLFCRDCDTRRLQVNEEHLARVIFGGFPLEGVNHGRIQVVSGYNYKRVKNGLLSILWRMSLSKAEFFVEADLGPTHEERIRQVLLADQEFGEEEYPIMLTAPYFGDQCLPDWILPPDSLRVGGNRCYRCLISGLVFTFYVGAAPVDPVTASLLLRRNKWPILKAQVRELPYLREACLQLGAAINAREGGTGTVAT